jgi:hypothetical protein
LSCETYLIDLFSFFRILNFKYLEFKGNNDTEDIENTEDTEDTDSSKAKKPWRKPKTLKNLEIRKTAEKKLKEGLDWMEFLKIVSHTNDSITNELQQQYTENGNEVYDGNDLDFDINDRGQNTCIKCDLRIYEKHMLYPCNDTNVCLVCITDIQESFPEPKCPNQDCGQVFTKVLKEKKRKK